MKTLQNCISGAALSLAIVAPAASLTAQAFDQIQPAVGLNGAGTAFDDGVLEAGWHIGMVEVALYGKFVTGMRCQLVDTARTKSRFTDWRGVRLTQGHVERMVIPSSRYLATARFWHNGNSFPVAGMLGFTLDDGTSKTFGVTKLSNPQTAEFGEEGYEISSFFGRAGSSVFRLGARLRPAWQTLKGFDTSGTGNLQFASLGSRLSSILGTTTYSSGKTYVRSLQFGVAGRGGKRTLPPIGEYDFSDTHHYGTLAADDYVQKLEVQWMNAVVSYMEFTTKKGKVIAVGTRNSLPHQDRVWTVDNGHEMVGLVAHEEPLRTLSTMGMAQRPLGTRAFAFVRGCSSSGAPLVVGWSGAPAVRRSTTIIVRNGAPKTAGVVMLSTAKKAQALGSCRTYIQPGIALPVQFNASGVGTVKCGFSNDWSAIGTKFYWQAATTADGRVATSQGISVLLGGI